MSVKHVEYEISKDIQQSIENVSWATFNARSIVSMSRHLTKCALLPEIKHLPAIMQCL